MPSIAKLYKTRLCLGDNNHCALYYLFSYLEKNIASLSPEKEEELSGMAADLYPNELERVKSLLSRS